MKPKKLKYIGSFNGPDFTIHEEGRESYSERIATVHFPHAGIVEAEKPTEATYYAKLFTAAPELLAIVKQAAAPLGDDLQAQLMITAQRFLAEWGNQENQITVTTPTAEI